MRTIIRAMTEEQHDKRSWRGNVLIGSFISLSIALSFAVRLQSYFAKAAIVTYNGDAKASNDSGAEWDLNTALFVFTAVVTAVQLLAACFVLDAVSPLIKNDLPVDREAMSVLIIAHAGYTLLSDFLLQVGVADEHGGTSVQNVAFFSAGLALTAIWLVTSVPGRPVTWASLFLIGLGCSLLVGAPVAASTSDEAAASNRAMLVCGLAFFIAAMRNIVIRQLVHAEGIEFKSRLLPAPNNRVHAWIPASGLAAVAILAAFLLAPYGFGPAVLFAAVTCALSTALFLVTTHVLRQYGVTSTALFGVWASLVQALLLSPVSVRPQLLTSLLAVTLLVLGHWLYLHHVVELELSASGADSSSSAAHHRKPVSSHEQYTRLEFLLFACAVVGVVFYVFQPRVSQRDLDTLSFVGLDKVIRRLLSVPAEATAQAQQAVEDTAHAQAAHSLS